jgi:hypothetical protein
MKNYVLMDYACEGIRDMVGVIRVANDDEFDSKVVLACSKYYENEGITIIKKDKGMSGTIYLQIKKGDSEYPTYLNAEEVGMIY